MLLSTHSIVLGLLGSTSLALASPAAEPAEGNRLIPRGSACTYSGVNGAAAAIAGKAGCSSITLNNVAVPAGTTLDLTGLAAGTKVIFEGTTTFGHKQWVGPLISISGTNIAVSGAAGHVIDGQGARWWDGKGSNTKTNIKPKFFLAHNLKGASTITGLNIKDTPVQVFSIDSSSGLTISGVTIDNRNGDKGSLGHNTDGFDIGDSDHITITGATVYNQDDCLAINSGTNIIFSGGYCSGGHGLSIGSVGGRSNNVVDTVHISSTQVVNSQNGVRVKAVAGATGSIKGVTYQDITLSGITSQGVTIRQDYTNSGYTGNPTTQVPITGLTLNNVHGTVTSSGTDITVECGSAASCSGWTWTKVAVSGGKADLCKNAPANTC
uniref:endo-polygalacturonase n=2 Tax=Penicillium sp. CGMCC 1669 TaxID=690478 RepID=G0XZD8_9EURO|nr:endo-polygalacturonase I [Penicillium sp. CGMCC 1669]